MIIPSNLRIVLFYLLALLLPMQSMATGISPSWLEAEEQLKAAGGNYAEQYARFSAEEAQRAGDPLFDFLFAHAAWKVGREREAALILQRVLLVEDEHYPAMQLLARIYLDNGNPQAAQPLIAQLSGNQESVRYQQAGRQLQREVERENAPKSSSQLIVDVATGYDDNANHATSRETFANFRLSDTSRASESSFVKLGLRGNWSQPLDTQWSMVASAKGSVSRFHSARFADNSSVRAEVGAVKQQSRLRSSFSANFSSLRLDEEFNYQSTGTAISYDYQLLRSLRLAVLLAVSWTDFGAAQQNRDHRRVLMAVSSQWLARPGLMLSWSVNAGRDRTNEESPFGRRFHGANIGIAGGLARWGWDVQAGYLYSRYAGDFFLGPRTDRFYQLEPSVSYPLSRHSRLRLFLTWQDNDSPEPLYSFDRKAIGLQWQRALL